MKECTCCHTVKPFSDFHKDRIKKDGFASACKICAKDRTKAWQKDNPEMARSHRKRYLQKHEDIVKSKDRARQTVSRQRLRRNALVAYGGIDPCCACCGESHVEFLEIDHINNDGAAHRREIQTGGSNFFRWLRDNKYPEGFQVLCRNCNLAKSIYGKCPHQREREMNTSQQADKAP